VLVSYCVIKKDPGVAVKRLMFLMVVLFALSGCAGSTHHVQQVSKKYAPVVGTISLGDSKDEVISKLEPIQSELPMTSRRIPDNYRENGKEYYIYYMRSGAVTDGLLTDDEFTPYVFEDGVLIAIGWKYLGGPKTVAEPQEGDGSTVRHQTYCYPDGNGGVVCI